MQTRLKVQSPDVVGMNMASEATLATELELRYANISTVDKYAHGIVEEPLACKGIIEAAAKRQKNEESAGEVDEVMSAIGKNVRTLAEGGKVLALNNGGFSELEIKSSYDSDDDDILNDFYNPILANTIEYCRITGPW